MYQITFRIKEIIEAKTLQLAEIGPMIKKKDFPKMWITGEAASVDTIAASAFPLILKIIIKKEQR